MKRPGRNDPCHCGSGKKYKKCHLDQDLADERARAGSARTSAAPAATPPPERAEAAPLPPPAGEGEAGAPPTPVDAPAPETVSEGVPEGVPEDVSEGAPADEDPYGTPDSPAFKRWYAFWEEFQAATLDRQLAMALDAVESEPHFDDDWTFELVTTLEGPLEHAGRVPDHEAVMARLEARHPALWARNAPRVAPPRVVHALLRGEDPTALAVALVRAHPTTAMVEGLLDPLLFAGRGDAAEAVLAAAWQPANDDDGAAVRAAYGDLARELVIDRHLAASPRLAPDAPALADALARYGAPAGATLASLIDQLAGRVTRTYTDRDLAHGGATQRETATRLAREFGGWLRRHKVWPRARVDLARGEVAAYVLARCAAVRKPSLAVLLPEPASAAERPRKVERAHAAAAFALAMPWWCTFLVARGHARREDALRVMGALRAAWADLPRDFEARRDAPTLVAALAQLWERVPLRP